ncbi:DUF2959 domain-containing protein [Exilibacterium tricleocarpae]|uniref:DUF2959 domain-containing protein n=2 Tax=Exilibacterium tricleocarpae TaxID=2591008 RepID=A0A545T689_9GAMM|nr:DUF2959 domain-containing protein [Exilibacterium tricleocarpae]
MRGIWPVTACRFILLVLVTVLLPACESAYYGAMEKVGVHKRDILAERIETARDAQVDAKDQFRSALEQFLATVSVDGGELQKKYETLNSAFEDSRESAETVRQRIEAVESVAEALFDEWQDELALYSDGSLKRDSERKMRQTRSRYRQMLTAMHSAEEKMAPVLETFQDQVLYLKHNLNARAIAAIKTEFGSLQNEVRVLITRMESSIKEAEAFIDTLSE